MRSLLMALLAISVLAPNVFAQGTNSDSANGAASTKKDSGWVEDDNIPAAKNVAPYTVSEEEGAQQALARGRQMVQQSQQMRQALQQYPDQRKPFKTPLLPGTNQGGYQPSSTYQRFYQQFFNDNDDDDDDDGFKKKRRAKPQFMPLNQLPGSQVNPYQTQGRGSWNNPWSSGNYSGMQQGFGAPMYVGPEVPYPTFNGIQYGPPPGMSPGFIPSTGD